MGTKRIQISGALDISSGNQCWPLPPEADGYQGGPFIGAAGTDPDWDLEARNLSDPDITKAGWLVQLQNAPFTPLTYNGPIDLSQPSAPVGKFNASLIGGVLVMQGPGSGGGIQVYRATDGLAHSYSSHVWTEDVQNGNSDYTFISNGANYNTNGVTFFYGGLEGSADRHMVIVRVQGTSGSPVVNVYVNTALPGWQQDTVRYIRDRGNSLQTEVRFGQTNGQLIEANPVVVDGIAPAQFMGVWLNAVLNHCFYIDFIRRKPINQYP